MSKSNVGFVIKHITKWRLVSPIGPILTIHIIQIQKNVKLETFNNERDETKVE